MSQIFRRPPTHGGHMRGAFTTFLTTTARGRGHLCGAPPVPVARIRGDGGVGLGTRRGLFTDSGRKQDVQTHLGSMPPATAPTHSALALEQWALKPARPVSLRQLIFFGGRHLDEGRLISSANYVRTELPTRIAHRIRDMQKLPYVVVTNSHISKVYQLYCRAFEEFRKFPDIRTVEDNDKFCSMLNKSLKHHLSVIPSLAIGVLECRDLMPPEQIDSFMNTLLRSRISRRVIAEQHLALTETFNSPFHFPDANPNAQPNSHPEVVGEVFLRCNAKDVVEDCYKLATGLAKVAYGDNVRIPELIMDGHFDTVFPYIPSHLEYMVGELLRNSMQATIEKHHNPKDPKPLPPIHVLICHAPQHIIFRVSDEGGGIPPSELPTIWSFSKGPKREARLQNLSMVPNMAATVSELEIAGHTLPRSKGFHESSLSKLSSRPPNLRLGMGLPMSRVYAEYWAGKLELHSLEGYGTDAFLQISKLGNKSEQLTLDGL